DLPLVRKLDVPVPASRSAGLRRLGVSPFAPRLLALVLGSHGNVLGPEGAAALSAGSWKSLRQLPLANHHIGDDGAEALAAAPWVGQLTQLGLRGNGIGPRGVRALLLGPRALSLACVGLEDNPLRDEG